MTNTPFPEMNVEKRESNTAHGIPEPNLTPTKITMELEKTMILNEQAKVDDPLEVKMWQDETLDILAEYIPFAVEHREIRTAVSNVMDMSSWKEVSEFVQDDECLEFFNMLLRYCKSEGQKHQREKDFIDGSGIGYVNAYTRRLKRTLEQCFDAKYYYKTPRPLVYIEEKFGLNLSLIANHVHPGHWSYPAGHGTKFLTAVEVINDVFHLDKRCYREALIAACVASMGRSGSLIHYPMDNLAGGVLTTLKEFQK